VGGASGGWPQRSCTVAGVAWRQGELVGPGTHGLVQVERVPDYLCRLMPYPISVRLKLIEAFITLRTDVTTRSAHAID